MPNLSVLNTEGGKQTVIVELRVPTVGLDDLPHPKVAGGRQEMGIDAGRIRPSEATYRVDVDVALEQDLAHFRAEPGPSQISANYRFDRPFE